jgi:hypothetical protein
MGDNRRAAASWASFPLDPCRPLPRDDPRHIHGRPVRYRWLHGSVVIGPAWVCYVRARPPSNLSCSSLLITLRSSPSTAPDPVDTPIFAQPSGSHPPRTRRTQLDDSISGNEAVSLQIKGDGALRRSLV